MKEASRLSAPSTEKGYLEHALEAQKMHDESMRHAKEHRDHMAAGRYNEAGIALGKQKLAEKVAKKANKQAEQKALETGVRGGRYYVSPSGAKVYVKGNPGVQVLDTENPLAEQHQVTGSGPWQRIASAFDKISR